MSLNSWKITAIIFIVLFILETVLFIYLYKLGVEVYDKEAECSINICKPHHDAFFYDPIGEICYCYIDNEPVYHKFIGG